MKPLKPNTWRSHLDELIISETSMEWKPFPKQYLNINIDKQIVTRQISTKNPSVHVVAKITEDFEAEVNDQDEESLPPRVFCWNDVSTLSLKVAFKTISAGLEIEYRKIINNVTFDIKSFSSNARSSFTDNQPDYLVYHIINPSLSESPISPKSSKFKYSFSNNQLSNLKMKKSPIHNPMSFPETIDASSLQQLGESISGPSIFIFDCPNAVRMLGNIIGPNSSSSGANMSFNINKEIFAFGATNGTLPCSSQLPYDLFTSCLLTPAKVALLMQTKTYEDFNCGVLSPIDIQEMINILNNSPIANNILDSLEKALEQFADRIAFESLELNNIPLFELVFRRDPFIANLFYHYLFACRVMKRISTTPFCFPCLPDMTNHPLWDTFDLEVDRCLFSLKKNVEIFSIDILLDEQMKLLEDWIAYPIENREMPDELSYLALLLDSPKYFERAIRFTAQFLSISAATTEKFLNTRAFPVLLHKIPYLYSYILTFINKDENPENNNNSNDNNNNNQSNNENNNNNNNDDGANNDPDFIIPREKEETLANFSFSIASSILLSPDLKPSFENYLSFWEKLLTIASSERLIVSCLSCLIQFDMNQNESNINLIKPLSKHKSSQVRTLSHFLLKKMKVPLELPMRKISDEEDPFCRVALVSRISESITEDNKHDLIFDLILSLGDLFSFVREEAITTLAQAIEFARKDSDYLKKIDLDVEEIQASSNSSINLEVINDENSKFDFFGSLKTFFKNYREDDIQNPIILSLAREIAFLTYDPSNRVRKRFSEFLFYLESILFSDPKSNDKAGNNSNNEDNNNKNSNENENNNNDTDDDIIVDIDNSNDSDKNNNNNNNDDGKGVKKDSGVTNNNKKSNDSNQAEKVIQPRSNLIAHILSAIVHYTPEASDDCYGVSHTDLTGNLTGTPAVSPSGLIACPCTDNGILCQTHSGGTFYYNFFNQSILLPDRFQGLVGPKTTPQPINVSSSSPQSQPRRRQCSPTYIEFIDDEKLLAVSDSSQVVIIDIKNREFSNNNSNSLYKSTTKTLNSTQLYNYNRNRLNSNLNLNDFLYSGDYMKSEPACSFWMEHPDNCFAVKADYNNQNFHLLEHQIKPESCKISIFDLSSQRRIKELLISKNPTTLYSSNESLINNDHIVPNTTPQENWCVGWLHSFSPLFYICTNGFTIYDERVGEAVQKVDLNLVDDFIVGCNSPIAMPLNVVVGKRQGSLAMIDFRVMKVIDEVKNEVFRAHNKVMSSFKVHREIPFGFGTLIDNSAFTVTFDSGSLAVSCREAATPIHSFALHATEATCIARYGSSAKFLKVKLED